MVKPTFTEAGGAALSSFTQENDTVSMPNPQRLPTFVVIGAMKCGTTSLHRYLRKHPEISVSRKKETNFFVEEKNWSRGLGWYESMFDPAYPVRGDFSPNYSKHPKFKGVPERMKTLLPDAKLIYMVREPVDRMVSQYIHQVDAGRERRPFAQALQNLEANHYIDLSCYYSQLSRFLEHYPKDNALVISLEALSSDPAPLLSRVADFLELQRPYDWSQRLTARRYNTSKQKLRPNRLGLFLNNHAKSLYRNLRKHVGFLVGRPLEKPEVSLNLRRRLQHHLRDEMKAIKAFSPDELYDWPPNWLAPKL